MQGHLDVLPSRGYAVSEAQFVANGFTNVGANVNLYDVLGAVDYFLSPAAAFVTGQVLPLTGGRL